MRQLFLVPLTIAKHGAKNCGGSREQILADFA